MAIFALRGSKDVTGGPVLRVLGQFVDGITPGARVAERNIAATNKRINTIGHTAAGTTVAFRALNVAFLAGAASLGVLAIGYVNAAKMAGDFEKSLRNMNSILMLQETQMYKMGEAAVQLSLKYNKSAADISAGMYHLASAGFTQGEIFELLEPTVALAVATQGEYAKVAKDVIQVIKGFGLETLRAQEISDKFIATIQNSLVTWDKLGEGVKFAMPWFAAAGLSLDELVASVGVLSDRALEAGIAGRGLRQSLAMMVRDIDDNTTAMAQMGIELKNAEGNMKPLLQIAKELRERFQELGMTGIQEMEVMMEDLGIRGATAFAHLVQGVDAFEDKLDKLQNVQGKTQEVAKEQMMSLQNQIGLLKNALMAPFLEQSFIEQISVVIKDLSPVILTLGQAIASLLTGAGPIMQNMFGLVDALIPVVKTLMAMFGGWAAAFSNLNPKLLETLTYLMILNKVARFSETIAMFGTMRLQQQTAARLADNIAMFESIGMYNLSEAAKISALLSEQMLTVQTHESTIAKYENLLADEQRIMTMAEANVVALNLTLTTAELTQAISLESGVIIENSNLAINNAETKLMMARADAEATRMRLSGNASLNKSIIAQSADTEMARKNALAKAQLAKAQMGLNLSLMAGMGALMVYGSSASKNAKMVGDAMALISGAIAGVMVYQLLAARTAGTMWAAMSGPLALVTAGVIVGAIAYVGREMHKQRVNMEKDMKSMQSTFKPAKITQPDISALPEYGVYSSAQPPSDYASAYGANLYGSYASGGHVDEGGLARLHAEEDILPKGYLKSLQSTLFKSLEEPTRAREGDTYFVFEGPVYGDKTSFKSLITETMDSYHKARGRRLK